MNATIMKIARIETFELSEDTIRYVEENFSAAWNDGAGGEDIYDIDAEFQNAIEGRHSEMELTEPIKMELAEIQKIVNAENCSGFMITY